MIGPLEPKHEGIFHQEPLDKNLSNLR